jgi:hypothetical protein
LIDLWLPWLGRHAAHGKSVAGQQWVGGSLNAPAPGDRLTRAAEKPLENHARPVTSAWDTAVIGEPRPRQPRRTRRVPLRLRPDCGEPPRDPDADALPEGLVALDGEPVTITGIDRATGALLRLRAAS